jgi:surface polysaccharide O-acyltransferase-like enzyme
MLVSGPRLHLWFVPFIVAVGLVINVADLLTRRVSLRRLWPGCVVLVFGGLLLLDRPVTAIGDPFERWLFALPALPLSLALGRALASSRRAVVRRRLLAVLGSALVAAAVVVWLRRDAGEITAERYLGCIAVLMGLLALPERPDPLTPRLVPLLFGAYLIHPLVQMELVERLPRSLAHLGSGVVALLIEVVVTLALAFLMRLTPLRRVL